ncbi:MAG TPA: ABC transporter ATP-binding protein [Opitutaceae bacterium]|nr:ABC transporter ATP-binding protein [Opitutaceae bacterium]
MTPAIEVTRLGYRYPDGTEALREVSFTVAPGECVGLLGPNGSGKSTLLLHLNGILPEKPVNAAASAVRIHGAAVAAGTLETVRRQIGVLFQDPDDQLFCATVAEDVAFGPEQLGLPRETVAERVRSGLERVRLGGYERRAPHHLSQGEKRRACLAGVLAYEPSILVLDEPTSGLDPRGRRELKKLLQEIPATKLIATHDLEMVVELCPRSIVLAGGRIVADGPTLELLGNEELMLAHGLERPHILQHVHPIPAFVRKVRPATGAASEGGGSGGEFFRRMG